MKFDKAKIEKLEDYLQSPKQVVIVTHPRPDGDALGSSLGLKMYLEKLNHTVTFITPTDYTKNLSWIPGTDSILTYESNMGKKMCEAKLASAELLFCLDFNAVSRLEDLGAFISASKAVKIVIDHHQQPEDFAEILFSDTSYCATAEMVYDILCDLGGESLIDDKIAECLYTGIATDNGFFQFSNTTP
ncbi:MAG: DHH family phosphoesterase, partial [Chitinophagales bacterium]|nr:DHH family phosphoesterase [Chitinophagales bacterium]